MLPDQPAGPPPGRTQKFPRERSLCVHRDVQRLLSNDGPVDRLSSELDQSNGAGQLEIQDRFDAFDVLSNPEPTEEVDDRFLGRQNNTRSRDLPQGVEKPLGGRQGKFRKVALPVGASDTNVPVELRPGCSTPSLCLRMGHRGLRTTTSRDPPGLK